jgi:uncharacterized membrane-anchored protein
MNKRLLIGLFCLAAYVQIMAPLSMIIKREAVLKNGDTFNFKTAPVDPYDAFRGRYVALQIAEDEAPVPQGIRFARNQSVFATIALNDHGFARFAAVSPVAPSWGPYIQARVRHVSGDRVKLVLPFDRYYMEESAAPAAEKVYREYSARDRKDAYVSVRVKGGFAVIEALYVGGKRIEDAVNLLCVNPGPVITNSCPDEAVTHFSLQNDLSLIGSALGHGIRCVHNEIQYDLLDLSPVGDDRKQCSIQKSFDQYVVCGQLAVGDGNNLTEYVIDIDRLFLRLSLFHH